MSERIDFNPGSAWLPEHRARYSFAAAEGPAGRVLDIACGAGLGFDRLAGNGPTIGADLDPMALSTARGRAAATSARLCRADAQQLPFADSSFALVCCLETIEHVRDGTSLLAEIARVLRPGGRLVLSTPNALVTRPRHGVPRNPWHVHEYTPAELEASCRQYFGEVELFGQRPSSAYGRCSFWDDPDARTPRVLLWKGLNRLPLNVKNALSRLVLRRPFFPGEGDFVFTAEAAARSHVLVVRAVRPLAS